MTAPEFFEKQIRLNQIDEDITYEDWLQNRIERNMPIKGDLKEAYKGGEFSIITIVIFRDYRNMMTIFPTLRKVDEKAKKEDKSNEVQIRFIKKK